MQRERHLSNRLVVFVLLLACHNLVRAEDPPPSDDYRKAHLALETSIFNLYATYLEKAPEKLTKKQASYAELFLEPNSVIFQTACSKELTNLKIAILMHEREASAIAQGKKGQAEQNTSKQLEAPHQDLIAARKRFLTAIAQREKAITDSLAAGKDIRNPLEMAFAKVDEALVSNPDFQQALNRWQKLQEGTPSQRRPDPMLRSNAALQSPTYRAVFECMWLDGIKFKD